MRYCLILCGKSPICEYTHIYKYLILCQQKIIHIGLLTTLFIGLVYVTKYRYI